MKHLLGLENPEHDTESRAEVGIALAAIGSQFGPA